MKATGSRWGSTGPPEPLESARLGIVSGHAGGILAMLVADRERLGLTIGQPAWRAGISAAKLRRIEAGELIVEYDVWDKLATF